eukprot:m.294684 g.294684  ORF g.294684 m.294684 type:complete len:75 (+) comp19506_c0_seq3:728-952(+)
MYCVFVHPSVPYSLHPCFYTACIQAVIAALHPCVSPLIRVLTTIACMSLHLCSQQRLHNTCVHVNLQPRFFPIY